MDDEDVERDYLKDQMYLWEKEYEAQEELLAELEADKIRKPAIIKIEVESKTIEHGKVSKNGV